jgi:hypothetical protein
MYSIINGTLKITVRASKPALGDVLTACMYPNLPYRWRVVSVNEEERTAHVRRVH